MVRVNVELGLTLCINEETRAFLKPTFAILDIDTEKDVDVQIDEGIAVCIKAFAKIDEGMQEVIADEIIKMDGGGMTSVSETLAKHDSDLTKIKKLVIYTKAKLEEVTEEVKKIVKKETP